MANNGSFRGLGRGFALICIGIVLIAFGLSLGGRPETIRWRFWEGKKNRPAGESVITDIAENRGEIPSGVRRLRIDLKAGNLDIKKGGTAGYSASDFEDNGIEIVSSGDSLTFTERDWHDALRFARENPGPTLELTLPEGTELDDLEVSLGAGNMTVENLDTGRMRIESGAGTVTVDSVVSGETEIKTGAGKIRISDSSLNDARIETGAGKMEFEGRLTGRSVVSTGAGSVELDLEGKEGDYFIEYQRGIGTVAIGDRSFTGAGNGSLGKSDAPNRLELNTGLGSVKVDFDID